MNQPTIPLSQTNKSAEDVFNNWINIRTVGDEVAANIIEAMKEYAKEVAEAVRGASIPLGKANERANIDIQQFIK